MTTFKINRPPGNFTLYGQAGDPTQHQYLCFLFLNNINEKVYLIMWFWFYFLIAVSGNSVHQAQAVALPMI